MNPQISKPVLFCAVGMLAAFFMPWVEIFGMGVSGFSLGKQGGDAACLWLVPILAGITIAVSVGARNNRPMGILTGVMLLLMLAFSLLRLSNAAGTNAVTQLLSVGFYATVLLCIAIIVFSLAPARDGQSIQSPDEKQWFRPTLPAGTTGRANEDKR